MGFQLKPVFEQRLNHQLILISTDRPTAAARFRVNVISTVVDPGRPSDDLKLTSRSRRRTLIRGSK
jgi:hypothetical protein